MRPTALREFGIGVVIAVLGLLLWRVPTLRPWVHGLGTLLVGLLLIIHLLRRSRPGWHASLALLLGIVATAGFGWLAVQLGQCDWSRLAPPGAALERLHSCQVSRQAQQFLLDGVVLGAVFVLSYTASSALIRVVRGRFRD